MNRWEGVSELIAVTETFSFTAAAKKLGISTAQVSRQISALENRLGTKLFYRTTRKVTATEAGETYYQYCRQLLNGLEEAERAVTNLQNTPRGKLKITAPATYGEQKIAPLINDFICLYPELEVICHLTNQTVDLVASGFDLAIRLGKLEDSSMIARQLISRQLYVCASPEYLTTHGEPHVLSELSHHNCLLGTLEYWRFNEQKQERTIKVSGNLHCNSGQALLDAALKGIGIVQLPDYYVEPYLDSGQLLPLLQNYQHSGEGVWALYPHNRHLSSKVRMLVDHLVEHLR
ncbi:LysR substrate-binding domain-containing protein [Amphritea sp. 1_MG-2023]|uniref:LysR substrate-binding domain-containing protein n=1 Tax=Amphritea sp. 1_MG-2023 TaxID=3062670 RepID=UPI0026E1895A|nr:LysR substrate-binding domain-containing protein [Amphritea sp. 1_MG-2023]MDO6565208.1 LysR substrate-binding domain-containing protein [Amphritea sp. 1_MG-2023]